MAHAVEFRAVSTPRAAWLLTRLRLRREWNRIRSAWRWRKTLPGRTGTGRKATGLLLTVVVVAAMLVNFINLSHRSLVNIDKALGWVELERPIQRGWIGVQAAAVTADLGQRRGISPAHGALIGAVVGSGPAKSAGLRVGDIVLEVDGRRINRQSDLRGIISATRAGTDLRLLINRDGRNETRTLTVAVLPEDARPLRQRAASAPGSTLPPGMLSAATLETSLLLLTALLVTLAGREIARPEWDLEWLATLPLPLPALTAARLVERTATNVTGLLTLGPFLSVLAWRCGYRLAAPLLAIGLTFALLFVVATIQTIVDTGLRLKLAPPRLRNLQAVISLVGTVPLLLAISMAMRDDTFVFQWAAALPSWTGFLPTSLAVRALAATTGTSAAVWSASLVMEVLALIGLGLLLLQHQLRGGVVAAGIRERVAGRPPRSDRTAAGWERLWERLPAVQRRELLLLGRDRAFLVQTLLVPAITVAAQVVINARTNVFVGAVEHPATIAGVGFALAAYTLMFSAFQTLNAEGQALWILCCVPRSLESVLRQKASMWAAVALVYPGLAFALAVAVAGRVSTQFIVSAAVVLLGVPIFALIATALGVFGCDALATDVQRRVRPTYLYLYMALASLYAYAIYASTIWQRTATVVLSSLLAVALWQKARDQFDYLLDPSASPPSRVSVSDGLIAALMFFVLQALVVILLQLSDTHLVPAEAIWIAFCTAGAVSYGVMRLFYWRAGTAGVPRVFGAGMSAAWSWGIAGGVVASVGGFAYLETARALGFIPSMRATTGLTAWLLASLAIAAAPVFEEFIFRGLIFGGLRRTLGPIAATLASAAIFAVVHPPMSVIPVFFMAICAGLVYERTKVLAAPMVVHALYNAAILTVQWSAMQ